uniref:Rab-GAP TBC domain-containing protein n=1 Tax=Rhodosorus marinus TaxID=101924 RepID=A0A7S3AAF8_9RHOD|mmetsp:Transcript_6182/g.26110  ORF Transcript_6182/g.26110 Transcript_6182/m.26110 type:complete len:352 (+) Transcript_6182:649-1704(+)
MSSESESRRRMVSVVPGHVRRIEVDVNWIELAGIVDGRGKIVSRESADDAGIASDSTKPAPEGHDDATPREPVHKPVTSLAVTGEEVADQTPVQAKETDEQESQRAPGRHLDADDSGEDQAEEASELKSTLAGLLGEETTIELDQLKRLAWKGLEDETRPMTWKLLLNYLPVNASRRQETLYMKRTSYRHAVDQYWKASDWSPDEEAVFRQISVDIPRTCPDHKLFHVKQVQEILQRILFVWALKHPASGYVQGMNDLVSPFVYVFLLEQYEARAEGGLLSRRSVEDAFSEEQLFYAEADSYWCLTALLETIQDYFTFSQPGIQKRVAYLEDFVQRVVSFVFFSPFGVSGH